MFPCLFNSPYFATLKNPEKSCFTSSVHLETGWSPTRTWTSPSTPANWSTPPRKCHEKLDFSHQNVKNAGKIHTKNRKTIISMLVKPPKHWI
jgi:hypothetical protein